MGSQWKNLDSEVQEVGQQVYGCQSVHVVDLNGHDDAAAAAAKKKTTDDHGYLRQI